MPSLFSKKRLNEIVDLISPLLTNNNPDELVKIKESICTIMNFDPEKKVYTKEKGATTRAWRKKKAAELGITEYEYACKPYRKQHKEKDNVDIISSSQNVAPKQTRSPEHSPKGSSNVGS